MPRKKSSIPKDVDSANSRYIAEVKKGKARAFKERNFNLKSREGRAEARRQLEANPLVFTRVTDAPYFQNLKLIKENPSFKPKDFKATSDNVKELADRIRLFTDTKRIDASNKIKNLFQSSYKINGKSGNIFTLPVNTKSFTFQSKYNPIKSILKLQTDLLAKFGTGLTIFMEFSDYKIFNGTRILYRKLIKITDLNQRALEKMYNEFIKADEDYDGAYAGIDIMTFLSSNIKIVLNIRGGCINNATRVVHKNNKEYVVPRAINNNCGLACLREVNPHIPSNVLLRKEFNLSKKEMISVIH